jgi:mono/diheme cytochrome c family protein
MYIREAAGLALAAALSLPSLATAGEAPRAVTEADASAGRAIYLRECASCHGDRGNGDSTAAAFLDPRPRDFTSGLFKLRTTPSGEAPRTEDIIATIARGIPGTAMPSFRFLSAGEQKQLAAYVLNLADLLDSPEPVAVPAPGAPPATTPELIARGKTIYEEQQCANCHGARGKGDGPSSKTQKDSKGNPIAVRDFTRGTFRGGDRPIDLYYRFTTGMDGTPMPSYGDLLDETERWALVAFISSLREPQKPIGWPKDPKKAGRLLADNRGCRGCHVLDDGKGGDVGPDLRISAQKLDAGWIAAFLRAPREVGKIYPWRPHRMPELGLDDKEIEVAVNYLGAIAKRKQAAAPDASTFTETQLAEGKGLYTIRCSECHTLGKVIETPEIKRQGPDLIFAAQRIDFEWAKRWILDPKKIDPNTKMTVHGLTPEQVEAVRAFVWKSSIDAGRERQAAAER